MPSTHTRQQHFTQSIQKQFDTHDSFFVHIESIQQKGIIKNGCFIIYRISQLIKITSKNSAKYSFTQDWGP